VFDSKPSWYLIPHCHELNILVRIVSQLILNHGQTVIKNDVIKVGLSLFDPIDKISDINDNDIPLNFVVTPSRTYNFN